MALSKIELKLGKKVITLTPEQFEELKQDMRDLDRDHHYYWYNYPHYLTHQWWDTTGTPLFKNTGTATGNIIGSVTIDNIGGTADVETVPSDPPAFSGNILSAA